ncbi:DUF3089 domain-containing protein [Maricaulis sp.]|uniref:DUF3089 domain-containing protein n=1 Tax=Maricaulis sp. TaxID=1486257 RepID=UPI0025BE923C|nr:DUF3089 domain-containing protein [Maricaulis sp.]
MSSIRIARWIVVTVITAAILLLMLAMWLLREQIFQTFQDPGEPYQTYTPPEAPEYADASAWYLQGQFDDDTTPAVFFVHPTTYSGGAEWNAKLDKDTANDRVEEVIIPNYAAPFAVSGSLFVPRYRQASLYSFMNNREDSVLARHFAYHDVEAAFRQFLQDVGDDRPIILVGVGQGGLHALRLGMDVVAPDEALTARLAVAYILEAPVPLDLFEGPLADLPACDTPEDVRCIYAFSYAEEDETRRLRILTERSMSWTEQRDLDFVEERRLLCTNPLLAAPSNQYASARMHRGGASATGFSLDATPAPLPMQTGAQCTDGILLIERPPSPLLRRPSRIAEDFLIAPFNLFYEDLRLDAARRSLIVSTILQEERRWAPPFEDPESVEDAPVIPIPDRRRF